MRVDNAGTRQASGGPTVPPGRSGGVATRGRAMPIQLHMGGPISQFSRSVDFSPHEPPISLPENFQRLRQRTGSLTTSATFCRYSRTGSALAIDCVRYLTIRIVTQREPRSRGTAGARPQADKFRSIEFHFVRKAAWAGNSRNSVEIGFRALPSVVIARPMRRKPSMDAWFAKVVDCSMCHLSLKTSSDANTRRLIPRGCHSMIGSIER
jgi:hypothetical protein